MLKEIITEINKAHAAAKGDKDKFFAAVLESTGLKPQAFLRGVLCDYIKTNLKEAQNARTKL